MAATSTYPPYRHGRRGRERPSSLLESPLRRSASTTRSSQRSAGSAHDLGRVEHARLDQVFVLAGQGVEAVVGVNPADKPQGASIRL